MSWSAPSGPQPVIDYDYRYRARILGGAWTEVTNTIQTAPQTELNRLTPGTTYDVQVRAVNQGGPGEWSGSGGAQTLFPPTPTPTGELLLTLSDPGVETTSLQNAVARTILEYGYGYRTQSEPGTEKQSIRNLGMNRTNVHMEVRLPAYKAVWDDVFDADTMLNLGDSIGGLVHQSAFLIPEYTARANPDLFRVQGLQQEQHRQLFAGPDGGKARLITCVTEWECARINEKQVHGYGLEEHVELVDPRTPEALYNLVRSAFENQENILFYYWWPSALATTLEEFGGFVQLRETSFSQGCWDRLMSTVAAADVNRACEYPGLVVAHRRAQGPGEVRAGRGRVPEEMDTEHGGAGHPADVQATVPLLRRTGARVPGGRVRVAPQLERVEVVGRRRRRGQGADGDREIGGGRPTCR